MFSIKKLLGHDEKFFDLLESSAEQADQSVHHLVALLAELERKESPQSLEEFVFRRRKDKQITQELTEQLCKTFITPFEREDIQALAVSLYKIPKTVEKIGERILICPDDLHGHNFKSHLELLDQAAEAVLAMVKALRKGNGRRDRAREKRAPADDRRRRGQTGVGFAAGFISRRLRAEADHLPARPLRIAGKSDRPLPRRGKHHSPDRTKIFLKSFRRGFV